MSACSTCPGPTTRRAGIPCRGSSRSSSPSTRGLRWLPRRDGPARRYLTEAVFPFYIVHQTALVLASYWLRDLGWPVAAEAACILTITAASCLVTYEAVRRVPWLRPLFGLKLRPASEGA